MGQLEQFELILNKSKTKIISDRVELKETPSIGGVDVVDKLRYLGLDLTCDRQKLAKLAKARCKKFLAFVKGKIQTDDQDLTKLIIGAYCRSMLMYYLTPILAAGAISKKEIQDFEALLIRK